MNETKSAEKIEPCDYAHWTGKPITPGVHEVAFVPQTIADGWEAYCSCGGWRGFLSFYDIPSRDEIIAALQEAFEVHKKSP